MDERIYEIYDFYPNNDRTQTPKRVKVYRKQGQGLLVPGTLKVCQYNYEKKFVEDYKMPIYVSFPKYWINDQVIGPFAPKGSTNGKLIDPNLCYRFTEKSTGIEYVAHIPTREWLTDMEYDFVSKRTYRHPLEGYISINLEANKYGHIVPVQEEIPDSIEKAKAYRQRKVEFVTGELKRRKKIVPSVSAFERYFHEEMDDFYSEFIMFAVDARNRLVPGEDFKVSDYTLNVQANEDYLSLQLYEKELKKKRTILPYKPKVIMSACQDAFMYLPEEINNPTTIVYGHSLGCSDGTSNNNAFGGNDQHEGHGYNLGSGPCPGHYH